MGNTFLGEAKTAKNDEFYTQFSDIQKEINAYLEYNPNTFKDKTILLPCDDPEWSNFTKFFAQNFEKFGLKKLISTSYATDRKKIKFKQLSLFEESSPQYDETKTNSHGKIFTLTRDKNNSGKIDWNDLEWKYLDEDGDFRSDEVKTLRDEADIIITNPSFPEYVKIGYADDIDKRLVNVCADEKILDDNSKIDLTKFSPITYDPIHHTYRKLGDVVGKAFSDGLKLK